MKRWIVTKRILQCSSRRCYGGETTNKVVRVHDDGRVDVVCRVCETAETRHATSYKDRRACVTPSCQHVRDVTVTVYRNAQGGTDERAEAHCQACQLERSAVKHLATAHGFMASAAGIRKKRAARAGRAVKT
jgi:hypothetical protein